ncbi:MAG TPA: hypothetical protein DHV30_10890, partial [Balneola sp.]|nr:hypothetical protein [Balneola sp.]
MDLKIFKQDNLFNVSLQFFRDVIGLKLDVTTRNTIDIRDQFEEYGIRSKKVEEIWGHINKTYYIGLLDDLNFKEVDSQNKGNDLEKDISTVERSSGEYPGILIFAVDLNDGFNPTRSNLTEINRTLNRFSQRAPVLVLARHGNKISLMLADRVAYKQEWREGEKVRKVSLLRDIDLDKTHAGHLRILRDLVVPTSGTKKVDSFDGLYEYWKEVLDTSELNKHFYQELSNWYFWAVKHVVFPNQPTDEHIIEKYQLKVGAKGFSKEFEKKKEEALNEHNATNVIRLLTRLLFVWFIKEKKLIPEELFDLKSLQQDILEKVSPFQEDGTMFAQANMESVYYRAILQNLFFASLNCPIVSDTTDNRVRQFRGDESYGKHRGIDWMMRYKKYFKDPEAFLELMNNTVPFLNGGLFECLDDKTQNLYIDGFSDQMTKEEQLIVPDYLFFGVSKEVDLSEDYGLKSKKYKKAAVKGLINILKSYKFTIDENTPIEEEVALDPELLGKVFENLLASYNPETKSTARKQTGSFYTPHEIVNYMVDESLIAYLKNAVTDWVWGEEEVDKKLRQLISYESVSPFVEHESLTKDLVEALDKCKILDPASGSGAFPMGILHKMVHMLQKLDPENTLWKAVQRDKAKQETEEAYDEIIDSKEREEKLVEINHAFDQRVNNPDYARKLYLIENCIYGVDIQPIATQIAK